VLLRKVEKVMKRVKQLEVISKEHLDSIQFAEGILEVIEKGKDEDLLVEIDKVKKYYEEHLEIHFQHEERTIFAPIYKEYKEHVSLAVPLLKEHGAIRMLVPELTLENAKEGLAMFAETLLSHTRIEEVELFPIIEKTFNKEQLDAVLDFNPID